MRFLSLRLKPKAAAAPWAGRGPGVWTRPAKSAWAQVFGKAPSTQLDNNDDVEFMVHMVGSKRGSMGEEVRSKAKKEKKKNRREEWGLRCRYGHWGTQTNCPPLSKIDWLVSCYPTMALLHYWPQY